jgi:hypothetical protein
MTVVFSPPSLNMTPPFTTQRDSMLMTSTNIRVKLDPSRDTHMLLKNFLRTLPNGWKRNAMYSSQLLSKDQSTRTTPHFSNVRLLPRLPMGQQQFGEKKFLNREESFSSPIFSSMLVE